MCGRRSSSFGTTRTSRRVGPCIGSFILVGSIRLHYLFVSIPQPLDRGFWIRIQRRIFEVVYNFWIFCYYCLLIIFLFFFPTIMCSSFWVYTMWLKCRAICSCNDIRSRSSAWGCKMASPCSLLWQRGGTKPEGSVCCLWMSSGKLNSEMATEKVVWVWNVMVSILPSQVCLQPLYLRKILYN